MTEAKQRQRTKPALSMNHLEDASGGHVVDHVGNVPAFSGSNDLVASALSARRTFKRIADGFAEVLTKAAPQIDTSAYAISGKISEVGEVVRHDNGMSVNEANLYRVALNGFAETAAFHVNAMASAKGIPPVTRFGFSGEYMARNGALAALIVAADDVTHPGLGWGEMVSACQTWADALASMAAIVNAEPVPAKPVSSVTEIAVAPEEPAE